MVKRLSIFISLSCFLITSCAIKPVFHKSHLAAKADAPFSDAVAVGTVLYLSGQLGLDHETRTLVHGGVEAQTHQAIKNIDAVLQKHGSDLSKVVKVTVILKDINDFAAFNGVYITYFPLKPSRTTFASSGLARDALIEIEVVAVR